MGPSPTQCCKTWVPWQISEPCEDLAPITEEQAPTGHARHCEPTFERHGDLLDDFWVLMSECLNPRSVCLQNSPRSELIKPTLFTVSYTSDIKKP